MKSSQLINQDHCLFTTDDIIYIIGIGGSVLLTFNAMVAANYRPLARQKPVLRVAQCANITNYLYFLKDLD